MMKRRSTILVSLVVLAGLMVAVAMTTSAIAAQSGHFKDVSIVFFPGGSEGGPFASVVYRGAKAAADDLGCKTAGKGVFPEKAEATGPRSPPGRT